MISRRIVNQRLDIIGKGAYGAVYKGKHMATGHVVALKIINLDTADDDVDDIQKEVSLLKRLMIQGGIDASKEQGSGEATPGSSNGADWNHYGVPNVIKYYGCWTEGPKVWIVMELAEGGSVRTLASYFDAICYSRAMLITSSFRHEPLP